MKGISFLLIPALLFGNPCSDDRHFTKCDTMACKYLDKTKTEIKLLCNKTLMSMIEKGEKFVLIDIRDPKQFERGQIDSENTINIDRGHLEFEIEKQVKDKDTKVVLYCCTGRRSALSTKALQDMGYTNVYSLEGGVIDWVDARLPLFTKYGVMRLEN